MNELIFFFHVFAVLGFVYAAYRFGKGGLLTLFIVQVIMANLLVTKQIALFGFTVTCTDVFTIGSFVALTLLQARYGEDLAKRAVYLTLFSLIFVGAISQIHLMYIPSPHDSAHPAYALILSSTPRIFFSSVFVTLLSQLLHIQLLRRLNRPTLCLLTSQALDTVLFSFLALYGLVHNMLHIILISYAIKVIAIFCMTPLTHYAKRVHL